MQIQFPMRTNPFTKIFTLVRIQLNKPGDFQSEKKLVLGFRAKLFYFSVPWKVTEEFRLVILGLAVHWKGR